MKILITHVFGYANKGDSALLDVLLRLLDEVFPSAEISGICRSPELQEKVFPNVKWYRQLGTSYKKGLFRRFDNIFGILRGIIHTFFCTKNSSMKNSSTSHCLTEKYDLIIACPGGYFEDSNLSILTNLVHLWLSIRTGSPVLLAPQSIGPFRNYFWKKLASHLFKKTSMICVREKESQKEVLLNLGIQKNKVRLLPDMAIYYNRIDFETASSVLSELGILGPFIASTVVDWYFPFDKDSAQSSKRYIHEYIKFADRVHSVYGYKVLLLKQIENIGGINGDDDIIQQIVEKTSNGSIVPCNGDYSPEIMRGLISYAKAFVGCRMHSNIFALQSRTPVLAISYLPKTNGIMSMFGLGNQVFDISDFDANGLFDSFTRLIETGEAKHSFTFDLVTKLGNDGKVSFSNILSEIILEKQGV